MKRIATFLIALFISTVSLQSQNVYFQNWYGGEGFADAHMVHALSDSTFLIAGVSYDSIADVAQPMLMKINLDGDSLWLKRLSTSVNVDIHGLVVYNDTVAICGKTQDVGTDSDTYIAQATLDGEEIWSTILGDSANDGSYSIICINRKYYVAAGIDTGGTGADLALLQLDYNGNLIKQTTIDYGYDEYGRWIESVYDTAVIIAGVSFNADTSESDAILTLMSLEGETHWVKKFRNIRENIFNGDTLESGIGYSVTTTKCINL